VALVTGEQTGNRARAAIVAGAAALLAAIVAIVALTGGSGDAEERATGPPPERCVRAWNADQAALAYGRHNFNFHDYEGALVTYLDDAAREIAPGEGGRCAVVFPSQVLDAEPFAAGQVLDGRRWAPISQLPGVELTVVAELQVTAASAPNAALEDSGELGAL
jgi:hypothetical protein